MGPMPLPPGFRFHPTDHELVGYYLMRKVKGLTIELEVIPVVDLYKSDPWDLPDKSFLPRRDMEWFFFCPRDKKYPNGSRTNRATASGYWKATGKDRKVFCEPSVQGLRKTLVFYRGRAPGGERTDWVMHEYRLCEDLSQATPTFLGAFALCRVAKRNEQGLKRGVSMGECKGKRSFPSVTSDFSPKKNINLSSTSTGKESSQATSLFEIGNSSESGFGTEMQPIATGTHEQTGLWGSPDLCNNPKDIPLERNFLSELVHPAPLPNSSESCTSSSISPVSSYTSLTEAASFVDELNVHGSFSSFPSPLHHLDIYGNEENMGVQDFDWEMSWNLNTPFYGVEAYNTVLSPLIRRQASDVDETGLWLQETACWS